MKIKTNYQKIYGDLSNAILSQDELNECIKKYQETKDQDALDKIVKSHLRLIIKMAEKTNTYNIDPTILVDAGVMGLIESLEHFNPTRGVKLSAYASQNIKRKMLDEMQVIYTNLGVSTHYHNKRNTYKKYYDEYSARGEEFSDQEAMKVMDIKRQSTLDKTKNLLSINSLSVPINSAKDEDEDNNSRQLVAPIEDYADMVIKEEEANALHKALNKPRLLTRQERDIVCCKFGLYGKDPETLQQIADKYDVSKERIHQIKKKALEKLKKELEE